jgi:hypothetical protein
MAMQRRVAALSAENERQNGVIIGLEQMVEEAGAEKLQLLKYCHELELRALAVDMMQENPYEKHAEDNDAATLLKLQHVRQRFPVLFAASQR